MSLHTQAGHAGQIKALFSIIIIVNLPDSHRVSDSILYNTTPETNSLELFYIKVSIIRMETDCTIDDAIIIVVVTIPFIIKCSDILK